MSKVTTRSSKSKLSRCSRDYRYWRFSPFRLISFVLIVAVAFTQHLQTNNGIVLRTGSSTATQQEQLSMKIPTRKTEGTIIINPLPNGLGNRLLPTISGYYLAQAMNREFKMADKLVARLFEDEHDLLLNNSSTASIDLTLKLFHNPYCKRDNERLLCSDLSTFGDRVEIKSDEYFLPVVQNSPILSSKLLSKIDVPALFSFHDGPLRPNANIREQHKAFIDSHPSYMAVHLRGQEWFTITDKRLNNVLSCIRHLRKDASEEVYVATDNPKALKYLSEKGGLDFFSGFEQNNTTTNMENAFLEILRLGYARALITTPGSTFSYSARSVGITEPFYPTGNPDAPCGRVEAKVPCYHMAKKCGVHEAKCFTTNMTWLEWRDGDFFTDSVPHC
jgi:hypothetical protein